MKRKLRGLVPLLVIAIGLLVLFYPTISNFLVMRNASRAVTNYDAATQSISDKQYQQMLAAAHAYNEQLAANNAGATDALAAAVNTEAVSKEYNNLLNLSGDGMMGYITMPRLHETLPIYHGTAEKVLQIASVTWNRPHCQLAARPLMRRCLATEGCPRQNCSRT